MSAFTTARRSPIGLAPLFARVLRSETRKLATVRSTAWALLAVVAFNVITAALLGALLPGHLSSHQKATIDSVQAFLPVGDAMRTTLAGPGVLRAVIGAGLYLTVLALLGFGLGTVLRSRAGAVAVLFGVFCLYAAAALAAGFVLIGRRDA